MNNNLEQQYQQQNHISAEFSLIYECGSLCLDGIASQATLDGAPLDLTEEEYESLYHLARRADSHLSFEALYKAVWDPLYGADARQAARLGLGNVLRKVNEAGKGAIKIEEVGGEFFVLRRIEKQIQNNLASVTGEPERARRFSKKAAIAAVAAIMVFSAVFAVMHSYQSTPDILYIEDKQVPLGTLEAEKCETCEDNEDYGDEFCCEEQSDLG